jgi:predicted RNA-binding protein
MSHFEVEKGDVKLKSVKMFGKNLYYIEVNGVRIWVDPSLVEFSESKILRFPVRNSSFMEVESDAVITRGPFTVFLMYTREFISAGVQKNLIQTMEGKCRMWVRKKGELKESDVVLVEVRERTVVSWQIKASDDVFEGVVVLYPDGTIERVDEPYEKVKKIFSTFYTDQKAEERADIVLRHL